MAYKHTEAFCLMTYACKCGHHEQIWNSRDGVTPFGASCPSCEKGSMMHVDWALDRREPEHKLKRGQKFWRDGTLDEGRAILRKRLEMAKGTPYEPKPERVEPLIEEILASPDGEFQKGWPMLDVHR